MSTGEGEADCARCIKFSTILKSFVNCVVKNKRMNSHWQHLHVSWKQSSQDLPKASGNWWQNLVWNRLQNNFHMVHNFLNVSKQ